MRQHFFWATVAVGVAACRAANSGSADPSDASTPPDATAPLDSGTADATKADAAADADEVAVRTITGAFTKTNRTDDGTKSTVADPQPAGSTVSVLVPNGSAAGYQTFPGTLASDGTFSIPGVPVGTYFLAVTASGTTRLFQHLAAKVAFTNVFAARTDLTYVTQATLVALTLSGLTPYTASSAFWISSSQASVTLRPFEIGGAIRPTAGATAYAGTIDWNKGAADKAFPTGLPDASKGDVVYVSHLPASTSTVSGVPLGMKAAAKYAKLTDVTLADGAAGAMTVALVDAPQTGSVHADMRFAQWGALLSQLHPRAVFSGFGVNVSGIPYSALDPDAPSTAPTRLLTMFVVPPNQPALTSATPDADYGTVAYGQYFDAAWHEMTTVNYSLTVSFTAPGAASSNDWQTGWYQETAGAVAAPIGPAIGTPRSPLVAAKNAFAPQSGVGLQPLLAWTAPSLGTPTEYIVTLRRLDTVGGATVFTDVLEAKIFGATSFRVPPGMLAMGSSYFATISAFQAPWDVIDHVFTPGPGGPYVSAECVTEAFSP